MARLNKQLWKKHEDAEALLSLSRPLTTDEVEQVLTDWHPEARTNVGVAGAFFTPLALARDVAMLVAYGHTRPRYLDLSARHGRLTARYAVALVPVLVAFALLVLLAGASVAQTVPPATYEPTPGLEPEPPILAPVARSNDLYLPAIMAPHRTTIGEPLPPVTPTPTLVEVTPVPTSTPTATPTSTAEPTGTPFLVTPPPLVDVPLLEFSNAAVGGVWTHVAVCNHTAGTVQATVSVSVTLAAGGAELHEWPNAPAEVGSGDCAHLYAILPTDGAAERMSAIVTY